MNEMAQFMAQIHLKKRIELRGWEMLAARFPPPHGNTFVTKCRHGNPSPVVISNRVIRIILENARNACINLVLIYATVYSSSSSGQKQVGERLEVWIPVLSLKRIDMRFGADLFKMRMSELRWPRD